MDRVFLDANVLFSAAYRDGAGLSRLWSLEDVRLITSGYAAGEAQRNLTEEDQRARLAVLVARTELVAEADPVSYVYDSRVPEKDRPILHAAIQSRSTHLLTGDVTHFGRFFGQRLDGVLILAPAAYLAAHSRT